MKIKDIQKQMDVDALIICRNNHFLGQDILASENKIAELTGFNNPNNFSTAFKELFGVSPSAYKEYLDTKKENEETQS